MSTPSPARTGVSAALSITGEIIGAVMQLLLIWIAAQIVWGADDPDDETLLRLLWCVLASLYLGATIVSLNVLVRLDVPDPRATRVLVGHPIARALATLVAFGASLLGLAVATDLISALGLGGTRASTSRGTTAKPIRPSRSPAPRSPGSSTSSTSRSPTRPPSPSPTCRCARRGCAGPSSGTPPSPSSSTRSSSPS
jgi:hypothetical protein